MKVYLNSAWWQGHESSDWALSCTTDDDTYAFLLSIFCGFGLYWGFSFSDRDNYTEPRLGEVCLCLLPG